ncbi:hypothetical protein XBFFL1_910060 [Xenorhabdus bovienii str. feltiae Florida]|nr:hypothetical protein XBFFR1_2150011 [Xenorhabdus bovienii str. feltiae France]CDG94797.1 hypothetical protein XBFFL1_910060 [Xenorhabdus bovienii str. feltiae Florida]
MIHGEIKRRLIELCEALRGKYSDEMTFTFYLRGDTQKWQVAIFLILRTTADKCKKSRLNPLFNNLVDTLHLLNWV